MPGANVGKLAGDITPLALRVVGVEAEARDALQRALEQLGVPEDVRSYNWRAESLRYIREHVRRLAGLPGDEPLRQRAVEALDALLASTWIQDKGAERLVKALVCLLIEGHFSRRPAWLTAEAAALWHEHERARFMGECRTCGALLPGVPASKDWQGTVTPGLWPWERCPVCGSEEVEKWR